MIFLGYLYFQWGLTKISRAVAIDRHFRFEFELLVFFKVKVCYGSSWENCGKNSFATDKSF